MLGILSVACHFLFNDHVIGATPRLSVFRNDRIFPRIFVKMLKEKLALILYKRVTRYCSISTFFNNFDH